MTVFNYFARKEDIFLDRLPELTGLIVSGVQGRPDPLAALRDVFLALLDARHPLAGFADRMTQFWQVVIDSPTLRARVREFLEELEGLVAGLFEEGGQPQPRLTAALALAGYMWTQRPASWPARRPSRPSPRTGRGSPGPSIRPGSQRPRLHSDVMSERRQKKEGSGPRKGDSPALELEPLSLWCEHSLGERLVPVGQLVGDDLGPEVVSLLE
jgi:hypothetical protein